jgi:crooked neck
MQPVAVKNRAPAPIQISAEQLVREAEERKLESAPKAPKQYIADRDELSIYQMGKRKQFEDQCRHNMHSGGLWCRYALWEASQNEFDRARSIFERFLEIDYKDESVWLKYGEMEMKGKFINHARNIWDRAVTLLPMVEQLWYKYSYMEELAGAIDLTRNVFERWMQWEPDDNAWTAFIKFEERQGEVERARAIFDRYTKCIATPKAFLKYAKWEEDQKEIPSARAVFERALAELNPNMHNLYGLFTAFARFEERCNELERVRVILKFSISDGKLEVAEQDIIKQELLKFEKRNGTKDSVEDAVASKRRTAYEQTLKESEYDYDSWFDYIHMEEEYAKISADRDEAMQRVRELYDRAVTKVPKVLEKRYWCRYLYLWINYAVFEETEAKEPSRARAVYKAALQLIPHHVFTFTKLWVLAAHLEIRQRDPAAARKLFGQAIGKSGGGKASIYKRYLELETQLGEIDRCRKIYEKWLENMPLCCDAWIRYATLERGVGEAARARAILELAIKQDSLDAPAMVWKAYIDLEVAEKEPERVRALYERLLASDASVRVWTSYAVWEAGADLEEEEGDIVRAREVFSRAYAAFKAEGKTLERVQLLNTWRDVEEEAGEKGDAAAVNAKMPRKLKKRKALTDATGDNVGWEEYYDYEFPDDEKKAAGLRLMQNAMKWKAAMKGAGRDMEKEGQRKDEVNEEERGVADASIEDEGAIDIDDI